MTQSKSTPLPAISAPRKWGPSPPGGRRSNVEFPDRETHPPIGKRVTFPYPSPSTFPFQPPPITTLPYPARCGIRNADLASLDTHLLLLAANTQTRSLVIYYLSTGSPLHSLI
ncbi:hypothetical protein ABZX51_010900 [Aspergillus tubingensis]